MKLSKLYVNNEDIYMTTSICVCLNKSIDRE